MPIVIKHKFKKDELKGKYRRAWNKTVDDLIDLIFQRSQELIAAGPINEGNLLGSGNSYRPDDLTGFVGYTAPYAKAVEFGTSPHFPPPDAIREWARNKLQLRGKELERATQAICWKIYHYGTEPQPYLRPAVEMAKKDMTRLYIKHLAKEGLA